MDVKKEYRQGARGRRAVRDRIPKWESACRLRAFRPSVTPNWATQAKMRKKCCYGREKNLGQYSSLSLSPLTSHTQQNITLSKIKCERFIFFLMYSSVIEVVHYWLMMFPHISVYLYMYTCSCMWLYNIFLSRYLVTERSERIHRFVPFSRTFETNEYK